MMALQVLAATLLVTLAIGAVLAALDHGKDREWRGCLANGMFAGATALPGLSLGARALGI